MSLYNVERPSFLSEVKGQDKVILPIKASLRSGNVPNVWLFVGVRGTGKTTVARIVSKSLNCEHPGEDGEPCGTCPSCRAIDSGNSLDVIELDAASHNKVEDAQAIIEATKYAPLGKCKVFILDEPHMFSTSAWNALLKTFEEPPANCYFILCTTEADKVPATIVSRSRRFQFERIDEAIIYPYLQELCDKYNTAYELDALHMIAKAADGSMRDALSILEGFLDNESLSAEYVEQALGMTRDEGLLTMLNYLVKGHIDKALALLTDINRRGGCERFLKDMITTLTDLLYILQAKEISAVSGTEQYREQLLAISADTTIPYCLHLAESFAAIYDTATKSGDVYFVLRTMLLNLLTKENIIISLQKEIENLAKKIESMGTYSGTEVYQEKEDETAPSAAEMSYNTNAYDTTVGAYPDEMAEDAFTPPDVQETSEMEPDDNYRDIYDAEPTYSFDTLPGDIFSDEGHVEPDDTVTPNDEHTVEQEEEPRTETPIQTLKNGQKIIGKMTLDELTGNHKSTETAPADNAKTNPFVGEQMFAGFASFWNS